MNRHCCLPEDTIMYDPPFLEALMITASFFAIIIIIVVSVLLLEGDRL
ncbi:putative inner membrane protein [Salmonella enterica subsp. enterica serovar Urbana str. R8-2977]|nr:putative inner membrane protein [Salmonella enterica subsp. enterica serovar Johannesburg str. S5-703]EHC78488.1 putative inner membrane protein [Salmonella enterica subsp. enterica serovar Montevideo str. S5-403]EHD03058.1 putative inner membrane protein [Salmonella enterica subsp. enterica serovar Urbana str. R8-2977]